MTTSLKNRAISIFYLLIGFVFILEIAFYQQNVKSSVVTYNNCYSVTNYGLPAESTDNVMEEMWNRIPEKLLNQFYSEGCEFSINSNLTYNAESWSAGYTGFDDTGKCICISIRRRDSAYNMRFTIPHEFGHYFDYTLGYPSKTDEWIKICNEEFENSLSRDILGPNGIAYYSDPTEFFAQEFMYSLFQDINTGSLEAEKCPKAHNYINKLIDDYLKK